jgi:hypothetical protein
MSPHCGEPFWSVQLSPTVTLARLVRHAYCGVQFESVHVAPDGQAQSGQHVVPGPHCQGDSLQGLLPADCELQPAGSTAAIDTRTAAASRRKAFGLARMGYCLEAWRPRSARASRTNELRGAIPRDPPRMFSFRVVLGYGMIDAAVV